MFLPLLRISPTRRCCLICVVMYIVCCGPEQQVRSDEGRDSQLNARYLSLLKRNPRPGTAFDRVFAFYADRGTLEEFREELRESGQQTNGDGSSWVIAGLVSEKLRDFDTAVEEFRRAEQVRTDDAVTCWLLGRASFSSGNLDEAADALERALGKSPARADQSEIYPELGRIYQRLNRPEKALEIWKRFEEAFPGDSRVQEEIAVELQKAGLHEEALQRMSRLAASSRDPQKNVQFSIRIAELQQELGDVEAARSTLKGVAGRLRPGSWLFNDLRSRIDDSYLQTQDYSGLIMYYRSVLKLDPDDTDAMSRVGRFLDAIGQPEEAEEWLKKATKKAPGDVALSESLISHYMRHSKFAYASDEYLRLAEETQLSSEQIESWGNVCLQNESLSESARAKQAVEIWTRITTSTPNEPSAYIRVAELVARTTESEQAEAFYRRAIELAPSDIRYREQLGNYYRQSGRFADAAATWISMAKDQRRTAENLLHQSRVLQQNGLAAEAIQSMQDACRLQPSTENLVKLAEMLFSQENAEAALTELNNAEEAASGPDEFDAILKLRIECLKATGRLRSHVAGLEAEVQQSADVDSLLALAEYYSALGQFSRSAETIQDALKRDANSVHAWTVAIGVFEKAGLPRQAVNACRELITRQPRQKTKHLLRIIQLEQQLGRLDSAIAAAEELVTAAPAVPDHRRVLADLYSAAGRPGDMLRLQEQAVRDNPGDRDSLRDLARTQADQFLTDAAIETWWKVFDQSAQHDEKQTAVRSLANLYLRSARFDRLIDNLQSPARSSERSDMRPYIAEAYEMAGASRKALETLATVHNPARPDAELLNNLSILAEQSGDLQAAAEYQKQLNVFKPSSRGTDRLARLLLESGTISADDAAWIRYSDLSRSPEEVVDAIDQLVATSRYESAKRLASYLANKGREEWQAVLRLAVIGWKTGDQVLLKDNCIRLLQRPLPGNASGRISSGSETGATVGNQWQSSDSADLQVPAPLRRLRRMQDVGRRLHHGGRGAVAPYSWAAVDYGEARALAILLLMQHEGRVENARAWLEQLRGQNDNSLPEPTAAWDRWYAVNAYRTINGHAPQDALDIIEPLTELPGVECGFAWLYTVADRRRVRFAGTATAVEPMSATQTEKLLSAFETVRREQPAWLAYLGGVDVVAKELSATEQAQIVSGRLLPALMSDTASQAELNAVFDYANAISDHELMFRAAERLASDSVSLFGLSGSSDASWQRRFTLAAHAACGASDWSLAEQIVRGFLGRLTKRAREDYATSLDVDSLEVFSASVHHHVLRNNAEAQPMMLRTLAFDKYWTQADVEFLVNVREFFRKAEPGQLQNVVEEYRSSADEIGRAIGDIGMAHLLFLDGHEDPAVVRLVRAAESLSTHNVLRLRMATWFSEYEPADALALIDTIRSQDHNVLRACELLALDLSVSLRDLNRAEVCADRLNGIRLDRPTATTVAARLSSLGLHKLAANFKNRESGSRSDVARLNRLMTAHVESSDHRTAAEVAFQLLQQTEGRKRGPKDGASLASIRASAIRVLDSTGQLDGILESLQGQIRQAPQSLQLHQKLLEYLVAANRTKEADVVRLRLQEISPETIDSLLEDAKELEHAGRKKDACDRYLQVFQKDPLRYSQDYNEYLRTFESAGMLTDLAEVLLQTDLRKLQNNYYVVNETIRTLFAVSANRSTEDKTHRLALEMFQRAWEAFPNNRTFLISEVQQDSVWRLPLMVQYARDGLIPQTLQQAAVSPWKIISGRVDVAVSPSGRPRLVGTLPRLLSALDRQNAMPEFLTSLESATQKFPDWVAGQLLLAVLHSKRGEVAECKEILTRVCASFGESPVPVDAALLVVSELRSSSGPRELDSLIAELLQLALAGNQLQVWRGFQVSPYSMLVSVLTQLGQEDAAIAKVREGLALSARFWADRPELHSADYLAASQQLLKLGYSVHALELAVHAESEFAGDLPAMAPLGKVRQAAVRQCDAARIISYVKNSVLMNSGTSEDSVHSRLLLVKPEDWSRPVRSVLVERLLTLSAEESGVKDTLNEQLVAAMNETNGTARDSLAVMAAVLGVYNNVDEVADSAFHILESSMDIRSEVESTSLPMEYWLAARVAEESSRYADVSAKLRMHALAFARRLTDSIWLESMLNESARISAAQNRKQHAEAAWGELLTVVLSDSSMSISRPQPGTGTDAGTSAIKELRTRLLRPHAP